MPIPTPEQLRQLAFKSLSRQTASGATTGDPTISRDRGGASGGTGKPPTERPPSADLVNRYYTCGSTGSLQPRAEGILPPPGAPFRGPCPPGSHLKLFRPPGWIKSPETMTHWDQRCVPDDDPTALEQPPEETPPIDESCECISAAMTAIATAIVSIQQAINIQFDKPCDDVDLTLDEIIAELRKRIEGPLYSCSECQRMLASGLGGTLEYAVRCAGACVEETAKECSMGDPSTWGKPCDDCGEECCICDKGICKPTPCPEEEEEEEKEKYVGWCQDSTGLIEVRKQSEGPPGTGWTQVALGDDEQAVATEAADNCSKFGPKPPSQPSRSPISVASPLCDLSKFYDGSALSGFASSGASANMLAGMIQSNEALANIGFAGLSLNTIGDVAYGYLRAWTGMPAYYASKVLPIVSTALGCTNANWQEVVQLSANIDMAGNQMGTSFSPFKTQIEYALNAGCRQKFLDPDKAIAAYLAHGLDYTSLDAHWAIAGICNPSLDEYLEAAKSKPIPLQLAMMRRREMVDKTGFDNGMRQLGYLDQSTAEHLFTLTEQIPTLSDIIRLMVRDAGDESIEHWPESDRIFKQKYGKQLKEWSVWQGIPEEFAKFAWRAHWTIPAPGQLFSFWHRLRYNPKFGGKDKLLQQIKDALSQQDILPFWQEHYLAVSFHPLTRVDVRRAYNIGAMDKEQVKTAYLDAGYSDANADILVDFTDKQKELALAKHPSVGRWLRFEQIKAQTKDELKSLGLTDRQIENILYDAAPKFAKSTPAKQFLRGDITRKDFVALLGERGLLPGNADDIADEVARHKTGHPVLKEYAVGSVSRDVAIVELATAGIAESTWLIWLDETDTAIKQASVTACQRGIKRRYLTGELDLQESKAALIKYGTVVDRANMLADSWECEKATQNKAATAAKLCEWLGRGAITAREFLHRLERIGYARQDAAMMLDDCLISVNVKRLAEAKRLVKEDEALRVKQESATRRATAQQEKLATQSKRASKAAATAKANREKQMLSAAAKVEKKCDCDVYDSLVSVRGNHSRIQREYGLTVDESLRVLLTAAETWDGGPIFSYDYQVDSIIEAAVIEEANGQLVN